MVLGEVIHCSSLISDQKAQGAALKPEDLVMPLGMAVVLTV
jgi:hypothetical protein